MKLLLQIKAQKPCDSDKLQPVRVGWLCGQADEANNASSTEQDNKRSRAITTLGLFQIMARVRFITTTVNNKDF